MAQGILQQNLTKMLGIDELSVEEQSAFLSEVGDVIFERSIVRLVASLTEEQQHALEDYLDTDPEPEVLLSHLIEHYKEFETILEEVVIEFKEDALKVLQETQTEGDVKVVE